MKQLPSNINIKDFFMNKPHSPFSPFTGTQDGVNQAGKPLRSPASLLPRAASVKTEGDAKSLAGLVRKIQGQLGAFIRGLRGVNPFLLIVMSAATLFIPDALWASDGDLLKDEISAVEKLFTGGYMRIGLLGVCGFAAIYGIVKQSGWIFCSGVLGCVFAYFMKDWILKTFTAVIKCQITTNI
jgi:hypothetical protein